MFDLDENKNELVTQIQLLSTRISTLSNYLVSKLDTDMELDITPEELVIMEKIIKAQMTVIKKILSNKEFSDTAKREIREFMLEQEEWANITKWQQDLVTLKERRENIKLTLTQP